jgi:putative transposase
VATSAERVSRKWQTVYYYFRLWRDAECFTVINDCLRQQLRQSVGKNADPSAEIIDSQSVKTDEQADERGFDAGKKVKGRKRHILVDTLGLLLKAKVLAADVQDRHAARFLLTEINEQMPRLSLIWADGGYCGKFITWVAVQCLWILKIVKRNHSLKMFIPLPKSWIVERTFSWLNRNRRLSKDYERKIKSSEARLCLSMSI